MNVLIPFLLALAAGAAVPFRDLPPPVSGAASIASLASKDELATEPAYARFKNARLKKIDAWFALGVDDRLTLPETQAIYTLVRTATLRPNPGSLCIISPRHYFSYTSEYGVVEALLCFECQVAILSINGWQTTRELDQAAQSHLNAILQKHGVPIPVSK